MTINIKIREKARAAGFDQVGFVRASDVPKKLGERLSAFLENRWHGDMTWLEDKAHRRQHPKL
ncbi:MAG: tRNA epoxyqueuosine(34) reductase QueG, partial [Alphaproteobacteria bacterium]